MTSVKVISAQKLFLFKNIHKHYYKNWFRTISVELCNFRGHRNATETTEIGPRELEKWLFFFNNTKLSRLWLLFSIIINVYQRLLSMHKSDIFISWKHPFKTCTPKLQNFVPRKLKSSTYIFGGKTWRYGAQPFSLRVRARLSVAGQGFIVRLNSLVEAQDGKTKWPQKLVVSLGQNYCWHVLINYESKNSKIVCFL